MPTKIGAILKGQMRPFLAWLYSVIVCTVWGWWFRLDQVEADKWMKTIQIEILRQRVKKRNTPQP